MPANQKQWDQGPAQYVKSLPVDKQKRMVKKAFRKLEKLRKETARQEKDGLEPVVQLIVSQDHMIREQIQRMRELDLEIEKLELDLRMNEEKTELDSWGEAAFSSFSETMDSQASESPSKDLLYIGDGFGQLDEQLKKHRDLIGQLSNEIDKEIESIWVQDTEEPEGATASFGLETEIEETAAELQNIKTDLENSMYKGLSIHTQLTEVQKELKQHDLLLQTKNQECEHLAAQLSSLQVTDSVNHICSTREKSQTRISTVQSKLCQKLSKTDVTDTDSDTGISSTHSQDSLSPCGELSLPSF
ncbi:RASF9 protein, partial [Amia calva]|nr:RASF9 protein [Amia calva]